MQLNLAQLSKSRLKPSIHEKKKIFAHRRSALPKLIASQTRSIERKARACTERTLFLTQTLSKCALGASPILNAEIHTCARVSLLIDRYNGAGVIIYAHRQRLIRPLMAAVFIICNYWASILVSEDFYSWWHLFCINKSTWPLFALKMSQYINK